MRERRLVMLAVVLGACGGGAPPPPAPPAPASSPSGLGEQVDCAEAYAAGTQATCTVVECGELAEYLGEWKGPFEAFVRELSTYRPFENDIAYAAKDCVRDAATGETMIIGRRVDTYPAFETLPALTVPGLTITGRRADGTMFMRTIDQGAAPNEFVLESEDAAAGRIVMTRDGTGPQIRVVQERDLALLPRWVRHVTIELIAAPGASPFVIRRGQHERFRAQP